MQNSSAESNLNTADIPGISFNDFSRILCRSRWLILGIVGVVTIATAIVVSLLPNQYTVSTMVDPGKDGEKAGYQMVAAIESPDAAQKIVTALNLQAALNSPDEKAAIRTLKGMTGASFDKRSGLLKISVTHSDPSLAIQIANEYFAYVKKHASIFFLTEESRNLLAHDKRLQQSKAEFAKLEQDLKESENLISGEIRVLAMAIGDLRAEIALSVQDPQQSPLILHEQFTNMLNVLNMASITSPGKRANTSAQKFDSAVFYKKLVDLINLEFHRSLISKLNLRIGLLREMEGAAIRQSTPPVTPLDPSKPRRMRIVAMAFAASLVFAFILAFLIDRRRGAKN